MGTAVVYTRTGAVNHTNRDRQYAACVAAAEAAGYTPTEWIHDEAGDRSGLDALYSRLAAGGVEAVVAFDYARLGRTPAALNQAIKTVEEADARLILCQGQVASQFELALLSQFAAAEPDLPDIN